jgi:beta-galactosidase
VEAVSYTDGQEVSRTALETAGPAVRLRLVPEKTVMKADGNDLAYVEIQAEDERGNVVPDAEIPLTAQVTGPAELMGFGSANPITDEDYTDRETVTWRGRALAILRPDREAGEVRLTVSGEGMPESAVTLRCAPEKE